MARRLVAGLAFVLLLAGVSGCGDDGTTSRTTSAPPTTVGNGVVPRLIEITMTDDAFTPNAITAKAGETVTLRFTNKGTVRHEAVIGDEFIQEQHAQMMVEWYATSVPGDTTTTTTSAAAAGEGASTGAGSAGVLASLGVRVHPGMNAPNVVSVEVGATGEVTYSLAKKAHLLIGCHEPGHYEAGMVATLDVI